jgi:hypothetical protein
MKSDNQDLTLWRKQIDESIRNLQERNNQADEHASSTTSHPFRRHAELLTAFDLLCELSRHAGISEKRFYYVVQKRFLYHLNCLYSDMSRIYKDTASRMDDRTEDEIYTSDEPPQLFK